MSNRNGRTLPFKGFSRGVPVAGLPIIGERRPDAPPEGGYFYQVNVFIRREGQPLDMDSVEVKLPAPIEGMTFKGLQEQIAGDIRARDPEGPPATVILQQPIFLGFIPQEELDRRAAERAAVTEDVETTPDEQPAESMEGSNA